MNFLTNLDLKKRLELVLRNIGNPKALITTICSKRHVDMTKYSTSHHQWLLSYSNRLENVGVYKQKILEPYYKSFNKATYPLFFKSFYMTPTCKTKILLNQSEGLTSKIIFNLEINSMIKKQTKIMKQRQSDNPHKSTSLKTLNDLNYCQSTDN